MLIFAVRISPRGSTGISLRFKPASRSHPRRTADFGTSALAIISLTTPFVSCLFVSPVSWDSDSIIMLNLAESMSKKKERKKIQAFHLAAVLVSLYNRAQQLILMSCFFKSEYFI